MAGYLFHHVGELALQFLVWLHPTEFRLRYGWQMLEAYRHGRDHRTGAGPRFVFWLATMLDASIGVFSLRLSKLRTLIGRKGLATLPAAGTGTLAASICSVAVCCPAHAALLGPVGLTGATMAATLAPSQPVMLAIATMVVLLTWRATGTQVRRPRRAASIALHAIMIAATSLLAFEATTPLLTALLDGHTH